MEQFKSIYQRYAPNLTVAIVALTIIMSTFGGYAPIVEGKIFPVTINAKIEEVRPTSNGMSLVKLIFENVRDCRYLNLNWFSIDPDDGRYQSIYVDFLKDKNVGSRGSGRHKTQVWYVEMPSDVVQKFSLVRVHHQCHPLWDTTTQIIP